MTYFVTKPYQVTDTNGSIRVSFHCSTISRMCEISYVYVNNLILYIVFYKLHVQNLALYLVKRKLCCYQPQSHHKYATIQVKLLIFTHYNSVSKSCSLLFCNFFSNATRDGNNKWPYKFVHCSIYRVQKNEREFTYSLSDTITELDHPIRSV